MVHNYVNFINILYDKELLELYYSKLNNLYINTFFGL